MYKWVLKLSGDEHRRIASGSVGMFVDEVTNDPLPPARWSMLFYSFG